jgi:lysophospholipid acyltransferase (LPLAT)-like uncharacterized protein
LKFKRHYKRFIFSLKLFLFRFIVQAIVRLLHASFRYEIVGQDNKNKALTLHAQGAYAIATWHQNAILGLTSHRKQGVSVMISPSFDGEIVAHVAKRLGLGAIRGSSTRGGRKALHASYQHIRDGGRVAITVDGPLGPRHEVKAGIIALASKTKAPILPMNAIADRYWVLDKTWDKLRIPKPFAKIKVYYGEPITVSDCDDLEAFEAAKRLVSKSLHDIEREAARHTQHA